MKEKRTVIRGIAACEDSQAVFLSREKRCAITALC